MDQLNEFLNKASVLSDNFMSGDVTGVVTELESFTRNWPKLMHNIDGLATKIGAKGAKVFQVKARVRGRVRVCVRFMQSSF